MKFSVNWLREFVESPPSIDALAELLTMSGVEIEGMLCSAKELGVAVDAAGLLILSPEAKIGTPIRDLFPPDTILDVEITPNRGDLLSHFGLTREIAALTNKRFVGQALCLP